MTVKVALDISRSRAVISAAADAADDLWWSLLGATLRRVTSDIEDLGYQFTAPWHAFLQVRSEIGSLLAEFGVTAEIDPAAEAMLRTSIAHQEAFEAAATTPPVEPDRILSSLSDAGFTRTLSEYQLQNVSLLARLPAAASFSVPGAGKTTEGLAYFAHRAKRDQKLLVVAPLNAFASWEREHLDCFGGTQPPFVRLRGGVEAVTVLLADRPRFSIVNYEALPNLKEILSEYLLNNEVFVFLDESHRIKSGSQKIRAEAALRVAPLARGKLILSGTPMPQSEADLLPQLQFLYPELQFDPASVVADIQPIFVRTTKDQLGLPTPIRRTVTLSMSPGQDRLYRLLTDEFARQADTSLKLLDRQKMHALGRSVMRLLQIVSNPALLAEQIEDAHAQLLIEIMQEGDSPKISWACNRARQLARAGEKVLIWSTFRQNVEVLASRLRDVGAVFIHGGISVGDEFDLEAREGRIRAFKEESNVRVLVANPATAAEGISLHNVCTHAIYVDRTYNAAHFMQSEDRIVRFGLKKGLIPEIEIVECADSLDQRVAHRLAMKINRMALALNDPSIRIDPTDSPIDPDVVEDDEDRALGLTLEDAEDLLEAARA